MERDFMAYVVQKYGVLYGKCCMVACHSRIAQTDIIYAFQKDFPEIYELVSSNDFKGEVIVLINQLDT